MLNCSVVDTRFGKVSTFAPAGNINATIQGLEASEASGVPNKTRSEEATDPTAPGVVRRRYWYDCPYGFILLHYILIRFTGNRELEDQKESMSSSLL